jgi:hypothetical protein
MVSKTTPAALLTIIFGIILGCVPVLNEYLHWNLWYVVPISGLVFGCAVSWVQFGYIFKVNQKLTNVVIVILVASAVLGYASVDYGIYRAVKVPVEGHETIPDGEYKISQLMTFSQYMKWAYAESVWDTVSYMADLLGAALGTAAILLLCRDRYPFCITCTVYKEREQKYNVFFKFDEEKMNEVTSRINDLIQKGAYTHLVEYCKQLAKDHKDAKPDVKISIDQRYCPICLEATILGKVYRLGSGEWNEVNDLKFVFTSQPGEHVSVSELASEDK